MITSLLQLPDGQLSPKQIRDVHKFLVGKGYQKDYQDFQDAFRAKTPQGKKDLMGFVGIEARDDAASPATGKARREGEVLYRLGRYGTPEDNIQTPKIQLKIKNGLTPVEGQWGSKAGKSVNRQA